MREILFRGKRKCDGTWTSGYLFCIWERTYLCWGTTNGVPNMEEVIPETVGEYTGLYDKNGRKIFEGDIVKYRNDIRVIIYDNITHCFEMCYAQYYSSNWNCNCGGLYGRITANKKVEVIGNVFDNPELLEVKQNG